jgi:hypothetical protein
MLDKDDKESIEKGFEILSNDFLHLYALVLKLRYLVGTIDMTECIGGIKLLYQHDKKELNDLALTELIESLNQERDEFYKRIRESK